jgi:hypothetical protein
MRGEWIAEKPLSARSDEPALGNFTAEISDSTERHTPRLKGRPKGELSLGPCKCRPATYHL